jgi:hypothetical protein
MRHRAIIRTATIVSSLIVLSAPLVAAGLMVWQTTGPSSLASSAQARAIFDSREPTRLR